MGTQTQVTCACGRRVVDSDVLQKRRFLRLFTASFVYLKYRCPACKRVQERFIPEAEWDDAMLREVPPEAGREERRRFDDLGAITLDEAMDFHTWLRAAPLSRLLEDFGG